MKTISRNCLGSIMVETALAIPVFLMIIFGLIELGRIMYIYNTTGIAAQQVASLIAINAKRTPNYTLSGFSQYADRIRYPGSVVYSNQFQFDVVDVSNNSTVVNGEANGVMSTKVIVTVSFPPPNSPKYRIPLFDPGLLIGVPIFGQNGLMLSTQATCFLERSRRPVLN